jgi:hypothetical protein
MLLGIDQCMLKLPIRVSYLVGLYTIALLLTKRGAVTTGNSDEQIKSPNFG